MNINMTIYLIDLDKAVNSGLLYGINKFVMKFNQLFIKPSCGNLKRSEIKSKGIVNLFTFYW